MTISLAMPISLAKIMGAACAAVTAFILVTAPSSAPAQSAPLSLTPSAQSKQKPVPHAVKVRHERKALKQRTVLNIPTDGNADLAFLSAGQYLDISATDSGVQIVAENELSPLDFSAGTVRVVDPDELTEIDLANDPDVLLAQRPVTLDAQPIAQASAAPARADDSDEDDGVLNRILMTFAGALAMASALRMIIA